MEAEIDLSLELQQDNMIRFETDLLCVKSNRYLLSILSILYSSCNTRLIPSFFGQPLFSFVRCTNTHFHLSFFVFIAIVLHVRGINQ